MGSFPKLIDRIFIGLILIIINSVTLRWPQPLLAGREGERPSKAIHSPHCEMNAGRR